jgi:hypothetical protein
VDPTSSWLKELLANRKHHLKSLPPTSTSPHVSSLELGHPVPLLSPSSSALLCLKGRRARTEGEEGGELSCLVLRVISQRRRFPVFFLGSPSEAGFFSIGKRERKLCQYRLCVLNWYIRVGPYVQSRWKSKPQYSWPCRSYISCHFRKSDFWSCRPSYHLQIETTHNHTMEPRI